MNKQTKSVLILMLADKGMPEKWVDRIDLNSHESVEGQIAILEKEFHEIRNKGKNKKRSEEEWVDLMSEQSLDVGKVDLGIKDYSKTV